MKPFVCVLTLGVCLSLSFLLGRWTSPAATANNEATSTSVSDLSAQSGQTLASSKMETGTPVGFLGAKDAPRVKALLAGFNRRKPLDSQLAILQRIRGASPADLVEMAKAMAGQSRSDPAWSWTKNAVLQRWVELEPGEAIAWAKSVDKNGEPYRQLEVLGMLANVDPERAIVEAPRVANPRLQDLAITSVIESIVHADPDQAYRLYQTLPATVRRNLAHTLFSDWAERNPAAAGANLLTLKDRNERSQASWSLMSRWALQDPASALAWAKGLTEPGLRQSALQTYLWTLGRRDPQMAISQLSELPQHQQQAVLPRLVTSWLQKDPEAATAWVLARPNAIERQKLIASSVVGEFVYLAGEQASKLLTQLTPGSAREEALKRAVGEWISGDPDAALGFAKTLPPAEQVRLREQIVHSLASRDPEKAVSYLKNNPIEDPASEEWPHLAGAMARINSPGKALEWAGTLPDEISRRKALPGIFSQLVQENPVEAAKQASALADDATRLECLSTVAGTWAGSGMDEALAWAQSLAGKDRETAMGAVLTQGASYQPRVAADQFDALIAGVPAATKPAEDLLSAASAIATAYFAESEQAAAQWAAALPQDDARSAAVSSLAQQWAQYDSAGASEWIGTLPSGKPRDAAVGQLVGKIAPSDPAAAFAWASTVTDSGDRLNLLEVSLASWRKIDAPAARTAIGATEWPNGEKSRWLDKLR